MTKTNMSSTTTTTTNEESNMNQFTDVNGTATQAQLCPCGFDMIGGVCPNEECLTSGRANLVHTCDPFHADRADKNADYASLNDACSALDSYISNFMADPDFDHDEFDTCLSSLLSDCYSFLSREDMGQGERVEPADVADSRDELLDSLRHFTSLRPFSNLIELHVAAILTVSTTNSSSN